MLRGALKLTGEYGAKAGKAALTASKDITQSAKSFHLNRISTLSRGKKMAAYGAMYGTALGVTGMMTGGPGSGRRRSQINQNSYYVRRMRAGNATGARGIDPRSLGGFA